VTEPRAANDARVVVVEDEPKIASLVRDYLARDGYRVEVLGDGEGAVERIVASAPALVVLDWMLPGRDGLSICRELRATSSVPVIMLTARVDERDRLDGFEAGADDYVCKPFSPAELVARVRSVIRRAGTDTDGDTDGEGAAGAGEIVHGDTRLDLAAMRCTVGTETVELTPVEFRLLRGMLSTPGRYYSRYQLMRLIYDDHRVVSDRTIDSHVRNLRRKLPAAADGEGPIRSRYGIGYGIE